MRPSSGRCVLAFQCTRGALFWGIMSSHATSGERVSSSIEKGQRHGWANITLHWLLAAALIYQVLLGWWMLDLPKSPAGLRAGWFNFHKSIGLSILIVVLVRLVLRRRDPVGPLALPEWQRRAATGNHALLYACMLALPLTGYLGSVFSGYPVRFFGVVLPAWGDAWPAGKQFMSALHLGLVWAFMGLAGVHVAAALWHWLQRDGVTARMGLPPLRRKSP
jgi:cytochrome b561